MAAYSNCVSLKSDIVILDKGGLLIANRAIKKIERNCDALIIGNSYQYSTANTFTKLTACTPEQQVALKIMPPYQANRLAYQYILVNRSFRKTVSCMKVTYSTYFILSLHLDTKSSETKNLT